MPFVRVLLENDGAFAIQGDFVEKGKYHRGPGSFNSNVCVTCKRGALGLAFLGVTHDIP
jgi:hypothetical protein